MGTDKILARHFFINSGQLEVGHLGSPVSQHETAGRHHIEGREVEQSTEILVPIFVPESPQELIVELGVVTDKEKFVGFIEAIYVGGQGFGELQEDGLGRGISGEFIFAILDRFDGRVDDVPQFQCPWIEKVLREGGHLQVLLGYGLPVYIQNEADVPNAVLPVTDAGGFEVDEGILHDFLLPLSVVP